MYFAFLNNYYLFSCPDHVSEMYKRFVLAIYSIILICMLYINNGHAYNVHFVFRFPANN